MFECEFDKPCAKGGFCEFNTLVLSGGKTGSTTLHKSFGKGSIHCHDKAYWRNYLKTKGTQKCLNCTCRFNANRLSKKGKELFIFSAFRDPVARSLSSFFQNKQENGIAAGLPPNWEKSRSLTVKECEIISEYAVRCLENYDPLIEIFREIDAACDNASSTHLNLLNLRDGRQLVFAPMQGVRIIMLSFETVSRWGKIVSDLRQRFPKGAGSYEYQPSNLTRKKSYYSQYKQVQSHCQNRFSPSDLGMKMSRYEKIVDLFWSDDQKKKFMAQWCDEPTCPFDSLFASTPTKPIMATK